MVALGVVPRERTEALKVARLEYSLANLPSPALRFQLLMPFDQHQRTVPCTSLPCVGEANRSLSCAAAMSQ